MHTVVSQLLRKARQALGIQRPSSRQFRRMSADVRRSLDAGQPYAAMQILGPFLGYPPRPELKNPAVWGEALELFAQILEDSGVDAGLTAVPEGVAESDGASGTGNGLAVLMRHSAGTPNDVLTLRLLAGAMNRVNAAGIGAMMLARAVSLEPDEGAILADLALTLLDIRLYNEAVDRLLQAPGLLDRPHRVRYALVWAYLHLGRLNEAREQWALALPPVEEDDGRPFHTVDGILHRCDAYDQAAKLSQRDLRSWNFAFNGSFLLHCSPYGVEQMNGRYGLLYDSEAHCLEGIRRLAAVLGACNLSVSRIFAVPEYNSQVLATAAARHLASDLVEWPEEGSNDPGLIVLYDSDLVEPDVLQTMGEHHPGQLIWVHAQSWMRDIPVGPDFITHLHEVNIAPWAKTDDGFETLEDQETESVEELANRILDARLEAGALADLPELCHWVGELPELPEAYAPGAQRTRGPRRFFFADSPVPSNSFRFYGVPGGRMNEEQLLREASRLLKAGQETDQIEQRLNDLGVETSRAHTIGALAAASYHSERADAVNSHLQKGILALVSGVVLALISFTFGPGTFFIAIVVGVYGIYQLIAGLAIRSTRTITTVDLLRIMSCIAMILLGGWLVFIAERYAFDLSGNITFQVAYWILLIGGYAMVLTGVWGLIDRNALRLRTGDVEKDSLTRKDVVKLRWILLVILVLILGHIVIKQQILGAQSEPIAPDSPPRRPEPSLVSPLREQ